MVKAQQGRLVFPGFLARTPWERLEHIPRYLKGAALRLAKFRANAERSLREDAVEALAQAAEGLATAPDLAPLTHALRRLKS